jgi:hypothetical protein
MSRFNNCMCTYTQRRGLILVGAYLWLGAMFNIILAEWNHEDTILFLQGESPEYMERDVLNVLLTGLNLACGAQIVSVTFGLLYGAFFEKKCLLIVWIWFHSFQLAFYVIYLFAGALVYSIAGDKTKVILILYGFVNILIGVCAWKMVFDYIRDERFNSRSREELNQSFDFV